MSTRKEDGRSSYCMFFVPTAANTLAQWCHIWRWRGRRRICYDGGSAVFAESLFLSPDKCLKGGGCLDMALSLLLPRPGKRP